MRTNKYDFSLPPSRLTHDAQVLHVRCSFHLRGKLVVGVLPVDNLLVARAYEPTLLIHENRGGTGAGENHTLTLFIKKKEH